MERGSESGGKVRGAEKKNRPARKIERTHTPMPEDRIVHKDIGDGQDLAILDGSTEELVKSTIFPEGWEDKELKPSTDYEE